jgi:hypothetical protein
MSRFKVCANRKLSECESNETTPYVRNVRVRGEGRGGAISEASRTSRLFLPGESHDETKSDPSANLKTNPNLNGHLQLERRCDCHTVKLRNPRKDNRMRDRTPSLAFISKTDERGYGFNQCDTTWYKNMVAPYATKYRHHNQWINNYEVT